MEHGIKKYKMGDKHPTKDLVFWFYNKKMPNNEQWVTKEKYLKWKGYDGHYSVYYLPNENYYGVTSRLIFRIKEHIKFGRDASNYTVIKTFTDKKEAYHFERYLQDLHNANGCPFTEQWRNRVSKWIKENGERLIYSKNRKQIICINTGVIYKGVRDCERQFNLSHGSLCRHLQGHPYYPTIRNLKFKYYESK